ncbi:MAG: Holliday junction branch migration protein RuvA [Planctomycetota bacterium]
MYEYLRGEVARRDEGAAVLEVGGIAYRLVCSASTLRKVPPKGPCRLFTHLIVREERLDLFGFADEAERHLFRQLLQVTGVGPAAATSLLSAYEPTVLASHIARGEVALLVRAKGIGKKTAERILVELRDRLRKGEGPGGPVTPVGVRGDAVLALCSLGLVRQEAEERVAAVKGEDLPLEDVVRLALR